MATAVNTSLPRPPFGTIRLHLSEDPIALEQRFRRQQASGKFPVTYPNYDIASFQKKDEAFFRRFAEKGERSADAPRRSDTPVVDPTSGFTSVGADAEDGNYQQVDPLVNKDHRPQSAIPYGRPIVSPIPDLRSQNAPWEAKSMGKFFSAQSTLYFELLLLLTTLTTLSLFEEVIILSFAKKSFSKSMNNTT